MNILRRLFGHSWKIATDWNEIWIQCSRCKIQENIPEERENEAYRQLMLGIWSWTK